VRPGPALRCARSGPRAQRPDEVWALRNDELRHFTVDGKTVQRLANDTDYGDLAGRIFGVPGLPIQAARSELDRR
jgi:hypothetical protein